MSTSSAPPNKGMKLTKPEDVGALQLIPGVPPDALRASGGIAALTSFVPCASARSAPRNKALHLTAWPSSLRLAVRSAGERREWRGREADKGEWAGTGDHTEEKTLVVSRLGCRPAPLAKTVNDVEDSGITIQSRPET